MSRYFVSIVYTATLLQINKLSHSNMLLNASEPNGVQRAGGSNPLAPTNKIKRVNRISANSFYFTECIYILFVVFVSSCL